MSRYYVVEEGTNDRIWYENELLRFKDYEKALKAYKKEYSEPSIYRYRIVRHDVEVVLPPKRRKK